MHMVDYLPTADKVGSPSLTIEHGLTFFRALQCSMSKELTQKAWNYRKLVSIKLSHCRIHCEGFGDRGLKFQVLIPVRIYSSAAPKTSSVCAHRRRRPGYPCER